MRNARSLLLCAFVEEVAGSAQRSRELEALAAELDAESYGVVVDAPRMRLALVRGEVDALEALLADKDWKQRQSWFVLPGATARLDALAVVGSRDDVAAVAESFAPPGSYVEPFAFRALGIVTGDDSLVTRAEERFRALGLAWYAEQTAWLRRLRRDPA
jgi:hypothetical protein